MFNNLVKSKFYMVLPVAAALVITGCDDESTAPIPEAEPVDLSQVMDMKSAPIQANPLTTDPSAVIVRVNGEDITRGEIVALMNNAMKQLGGRIPPQQMQQVQAQMYEQFKNDLITKKLMDAAVAAANIVIPDSEITDALNEIRTRIPEGQTLEEALVAQGTTLDELKENISSDMATRKFLEEKTSTVPEATEADAQEYYDSNPDKFNKPESISASHILIKFDGSESEADKTAKKAELEKIRADIIAGTVSFEEAAKTHSGCPSGAQGGSLGTFGKGQMVPEFEATAFAQEVDEIGDIVETQFGYHVIKVSDHQDEGTVGFEEAKDQLIAGLSGQNKQQAIAEYIESLRNSATIQELAK